ncbi:small s [Trichoderma arundinaceum]|uniref:Small s n=1 Tax=Trichoderma arundinaceum TaxID=490622 RepID=A0A395NIB4_TRIAR|nr:small s [Trichoderma arundinaceum]
MDGAGNAISIFNFIIESFGFIQLARDFENEFERYQLKLDVIQLRISRWGEASGLIHDNSNESSAPQHVDSGASKRSTADGTSGAENIPKEKMVEEILVTIRDTLVRAQRNATRMKTGLTTNNSQPLDPNLHIPSDLKRMRTRILGILDKRRIQKNQVVDSVKWAFYKRDQFERFIADVSSLTDELEKLAPPGSPERLHNISNEECKGLNKPNLEELKEIAEGCDPWLEGAVEKALTQRQGSDSYTITQSYNTGMVTGVHHGDIKGVSNGNNNAITNHWGRA